MPGDQTTNLRATATDSARQHVPMLLAAHLHRGFDRRLARPSLTDTDPNSPANDNNPEVKGSAEAGSTVRIYSTPDCSGAALVSGASAELTAGITVAVPGDQTTSLRATATDSAGNASVCSSALPYTEDSTAPSMPTINDTDPDSPAERQQPRGQGLR